MNRKWFKQFKKYITKVYDFKGIVNSPNDTRIAPRIRVRTVFISLFTCFVLRVRSFNLLEGLYIKNGKLKKLTGETEKNSPSADTLDYSLVRTDTEELFKTNIRKVVGKARENKIYRRGTVDGYIVAGIDGTELYNSYSEWPGWSKRRVTRKSRDGGNEEADQYYVRGVLAEYIGEGVKLYLGAVRQEKEEYEVDAAIRLIGKLYEQGKHYCDVIVSDALYLRTNYIKAVKAQNKEVIIRLKNENYNIRKDADGLFGARQADNVIKDVRIRGESKNVLYDLEIWDEEGFTSWEKAGMPLRVVKIREKKNIRTYKGGEKITEETREIYALTTLTKSQMKGETVWRTIHLRWDIENNGINELKNSWNLSHCYNHDVTAIEAIMLIMLMAVNLFTLFVERNLKEYSLYGLTRLEVVEEFKHEFMSTDEYTYRLYIDDG